MIKFIPYQTDAEEDRLELEELLPPSDEGINYPPYPDKAIWVAPFEVYTNGFFPFAVAIQHAKGLTIEVESPIEDEDLVAVLDWDQKDAAYVLVQLQERTALTDLLEMPGLSLSSRGESSSCEGCAGCNCGDEEQPRCDCGCQDDDSDPDPVN